MGEFFQGWRRKTGLVTLLVACVFLAGWVRSLGIIDVMHAPLGRHYEIAFSSGGYSLACRVGYDEEGNEYLDWDTQPTSNYDPSRRYSALIDIGFDDPIEWFGRWAGFGIGATPSRFRHFLREGFIIIPYWMIVIPLTLLSVSLLLTKPGQSTSKKGIEPSANEEN